MAVNPLPVLSCDFIFDSLFFRISHPRPLAEDRLHSNVSFENMRINSINKPTSLFFSSVAGLVLGSYVSAELLYLHYSDEQRTIKDVFSNTIEAALSAPITMTLGVFLNFGIYGPYHGIIIMIGIISAITAIILYSQKPNVRYLALLMVGVLLWAHNNYLTFSAMMSV